MRRALVLGGGGLTGIGWELGVLSGLQEAGVDLTEADLIVGTSAGSVVGAQITSGEALETLFARQLRSPNGEVAARISRRVLARMVWAFLTERDPARARARIGRIAHARATASLSSSESLVARREVIAARLPSHDWPERDLRITAVNARTGQRAAFGRDSGVPLPDAVLASCAVPGVWPPAIIGGRLFIDGGVSSAANVDLAEGYDHVVVLAPIDAGVGHIPSTSEELAQLPGTPRTALVVPSAAAKEAIGSNPLDPARRAPAARAGRAQAAEVLAEVRAAWGTADTG
ncbi:patatin [Nocardiopsis gilva YIM 90087]|uniref:Patatin n=1 Tax=Nocardiopsis gilva YIM 90087 TaxID=1235441 RepID=A0A223S376_9ACTN|nr:patatin-like phospholipase family protein [Nocardiopsis gilva]ASU82527.1 patatin [Nocardiopsis gilva YIM 90087]